MPAACPGFLHDPCDCACLSELPSMSVFFHSVLDCDHLGNTRGWRTRLHHWPGCWWYLSVRQGRAEAARVLANVESRLVVSEGA